MALRAVAIRLCAKRAGTFSRVVQSRAFSDGRVLNDEERAAENMYIRKIEKEKLEKAKQGIKHESSASGSSTSEPGSTSIPGPSTDSSKNIAVFAGVAAVLAVGWWLVRPTSKKQEEKN